MTIEDLIEALSHFPKEAMIVFDFDDAISYDFVQVTYDRGEVVIHVEGEDDDDIEDTRTTEDD
jgi:hypothetical protein